ncbi:protein YgfX [Aliivibrio fischeri]|uniref:protein YgfX n=1 Tax=Aliivibrio fischeri TaxID=668 RepID=UPI0009BE5BE6|nr:protein YgfX [Aliivibrio fischeri]
MSTTSASYVKITLNFSYIAYLFLNGSYFCFGWAILLMGIVPFPLLPLFFYFIYKQVSATYYQLLELQGRYTFSKKETDDHRDWVVKRMLWSSRSLSIIYAENAYTKQFFYLFSDAIDKKKHHQLMVLLK